MTTLERSAYSFRRQGSSGHIWNNRLAGGQPPVTTARGTENSQQNRSNKFEEVSNIASKSVEMETNEDENAAKPSSRSESKPQRCSCIAIFGRCAKTPAS